MIIKARTRHSQPPAAAADAKRLPVAEPRAASKTSDAAVFFRLFFSAVSHEVANSLQGLRALDEDPNSANCEHITREIILNFNRLRTLGSLSPAMSDDRLTGEFAMLFPDEGISADNLSDETKGVLLRNLKIRALAELRTSLIDAGPVFSAIEGSESMKANLNRALTYGNLLCGALEKIILGDFDLSSEIIPQKVLGRSSVLRAMTSTAREAKVQIHLAEIEPSLFNKEVMSNPLFLRLILANIYSNAKRACSIAGTDPLIQVFMTSEGGNVNLCFVDRGIGMDYKTITMLNTGVNVTTKEGEGHGIGFSYCRNLAEKLGGKLYVEDSTPGKGTVVVLQLPFSK